MGNPMLLTGPKGKVGIVHIPSTGGRSLCAALGLQQAHLTARRLRKRYGLEPDRIVGIARHPLTHAVSWFCHVARSANIRRFRSFVRHSMNRRGVWRAEGLRHNPLCQTTWLDGCRHVVLYPDVQRAADIACDLCGLSRVKVPWIGRSMRPKWTEYYDDDAKRAVLSARQTEIDRWFKSTKP